jgi:sugar lactone lactonase YvrE
MINPTTHTITAFATPTAGSLPRGIACGPDGNLWFTEAGASSAGKIGEINPATHAITEFAVPHSGSASSPHEITSGPDGNLWFTEALADNIGMINPNTHAMNEFPIPTAGAYPVGITAGPDGNIWFAEEWSGGKIGMINPNTHAITEYTIPYANTSPYGVVAGPDGNLWFTDNGANAIGVVTLDQTSTMHLVITQQPPASVNAGSGFGLTVQAQDSSGNLITSFNGTVTVALAMNPGGATLGGTLTVTASGGAATFSGLTLDKAGSGYTLVATTSGLGQGVTSAMSVTPASPIQLVITQQPPSTVKVSTPFSMQASIEDAYGNVVTTASGSVSVAFANNPTGATLGRHDVRDHQPGRGQLHQPVDQQGRLGLHAPGLQQRADLRYE